jgi:hypothetical protein
MSVFGEAKDFIGITNFVSFGLKGGWHFSGCSHSTWAPFLGATDLPQQISAAGTCGTGVHWILKLTLATMIFGGCEALLARPH